MAITPYDDMLENMLDDEQGPQAPKPAEAPTLADRYGAILDSHSNGQKTQLRGSMIQAGKTSADEAVEAQKLGTALGIPPGVVLRDLPTFRERAKQRNIPYEDIATQSPTLAKQLTADPAFAAAVQDDLEPLGFLEWLTTAPKRALAQKNAQNEAAMLQTASLYRTLTTAEREQLEAAKKRGKDGGQLGAGQSWFRGAIVGGLQILPDLWGGALEGARMAPRFAIGGATAAGVLGQLGPQAMTPEELITVPGGFIAGLKAGALAGGALYTFNLEAGNAFDEFTSMKDETGLPMDRDVARAAALGVGAINGALEVPGLLNMAKVIPGFKQLKGVLTVNAMKAALKIPTIRAALGEAIKTYAGTLTVETAQEVAQRAATIAGGEMAKAAANMRGSDYTHQTFGQIAEDLANEGAGALQAFSLMPALGVATEFYSGTRRASRASDNVRFFQALGAGAKQSKTLERLPQAVRALVAEATKDGGIESLYVPVDSWVQYWQSQDIDPRDMAATVSGDRDAYDRAVETRTDLKIPLANYTATLAGTDHNKYFAHEMRFGPEEMNAREATQYREQQQARKAAEDGTVAVPTPKERIRQDAITQAMAAGHSRADAETVVGAAEAFFGEGLVSQASGMDPYDLYKRSSLTGSRETSGAQPKGPAAAAPPPVVPGAQGEGSAGPAVDVQPGLLAPVDGETPAGGPTPGPQDGAGAAKAEGEAEGGDWMARLTAGSRGRQAAVVARFAERGIVSSRNRNVQHVIHPSTAEPGRLQVTSFVDGEPIGHLVVNTIEDAAREVAADTLDPLPGQQEDGNVANREGQDAGTAGEAGAEGAVPATGAGVPGGAGERGAAGAGGQDAGRSGGARAVEGRAAEIPEAYREYFAALTGPARSLGFTGTDDQLADIFLERLDAAKQAAEDYQEILNEDVVTESDLLKAIVAAGGLGIEEEAGTDQYSKNKKGKLLGGGGMVGELEHMLESLERPKINSKTGKPMPRQFNRHGYLPGAKRTRTGPFVIRRKGGQTVDRIFEALQEDPRYEGRWEGLADFLEDINEAIQVETGQRKKVAASADVWKALRSYYRVRDDFQWWMDVPTASRSVDDEAVDNMLDAAGIVDESLEGDVEASADSFNPAEYEQGLFDDPGDGVDRLTTGELQPRLPGAENVRDQEVQQPQLGDVGFSLEGQADQRSAVQETLFGAPVPPAKPTKAKERQVPEGQQELFQGAWHGSPYIFERFMLHAIGTGEGAQAYGWGLYFASLREVADEYRRRLAGDRKGPLLSFDGTPAFDREIGLYHVKWKQDRGTWVATREDQDQDIRRGLLELHARASFFKGRPGVLERIRGELKSTIANMDKTLERGETFSGDAERDRYDQDNYRAALKVLEQYGDLLTYTNEPQPGRTYKVEIPENDVLLDWDAPISEQPPAVRAALERLGVEAVEPEKWVAYQLTDADITRGSAPGRKAGEWIAAILTPGGAIDSWGGNAWPTELGAQINAEVRNEHRGKKIAKGAAGEQAYRALGEKLADADKGRPDDWNSYTQTINDRVTNEERASRALAAEGVKGIRYLDGFSRRKGEGSHNFVIFDDNLIEITEFDQSVPGEAELTPEALEAWVQELKREVGPDLETLNLVLDGSDVFVESFVVKRGAQRAGLGTRVMGELTKFADEHEARLTLTPAHRDEIGAGEPTSHARLIKFYRRFGFVENRGRNVDPKLSAGMYREPTTQVLQPAKPKKPAVPKNPLIIQHNLSMANLRHVLKMGGLPVPALAITKADDAITSFGEITLIGPRAMADPQGYAGTKVFAADVYSPRYPTVHFKISREAEKRLSARLEPYNELTGAKYFDIDQLQRDGARYLRTDARVMAAFLDEQGVKVERAKTNADPSRDEAYYQNIETRIALERAIEQNDLGRQFEAFTESLLASLEPSEHIFKGFTNQGNRSYKPHTLENVVAELKKGLRAGESEGNLYGVGQLRAHYAPQFRTLAGIQNARDLIVNDNEFDRVKNEVESEFFEIADELKARYKHDADSFRYSDTVLAVLEEARSKGLRATLASYGFEGVQQDTLYRIAQFLDKLRAMPTEYFEAKILREVDLAEFKAAVVPEKLPADLVEALKARGLRVETYAAVESGDKATNALPRQAAVEKVARELGEDVLFQDDKAKRRRGAIRFQAGTGMLQGRPARQVNIATFEEADLSTWLHETGHLFLEVLDEVSRASLALDEANRTEAQKKLLADRQTLLEWFGLERWDQVETEHHEQFARGVEAYFMEGKAPSLELRGVFARYRAWLLGIYKSIKALRVNLTPEVRRVMDRMFASERAIQEAEQAGNIQAMFSTPESMGYTPEEFAPYRQAVEDASRSAQEMLELQLLAEIQREQTSAWKERRDEIRAAVERDVHQRPVYQALYAMQKGERPDGTPLTEGMETQPLKLSRKLIVERYGADKLKRLPRPYIYSVDGGADPDVVASMFGFSSGDELLLEVEAAGAMRAVIEYETDQRMLQEHGSILLDGTLYERATAALGNKDREKVVRMELRALAQLRRVAEPFILAGDRALAAEQKERAYERRWFEAETKLKIAIAEGHKQVEIDALEDEVKNLRQKARGGPSAIRAALPPRDIIEGLARDRVAVMRLHELQPSIYWSAARQASQASVEAAARQDFDGAIRHKQQELISLEMFRTVAEARKDVDRRVQKAKEYGKGAVRQRLGQAGGSYLEQIDGILERYEFQKLTKKALQQRADIRDWAAAIEAQGLPVDLPEAVLNEARRISFTELAYEELVGVTDGLDMIAHLARLSLRMIKEERAKKLAEVEAEVSESIRLNKEKREQRTTRDRSGAGERWRVVGMFFAAHRKIASLARQFDGFVDGGPAWEYLIRPLNAAADAEATMNHQAAKGMGALVEKAFPGLKKRQLWTRTKTAEVGKSFSKMERILIALNWGNEGNRQRIRAYEKWSDDQVEAVLAPLTRSDWEFIQGVWDLIDSYWPQIEAKQKRVVGVAPAKVERAVVRTRHGEYAGGYFPLQYDDRLDSRIASKLESETGNVQKLAAYVAASTKRGHTKDRVKNVDMPIRYDFGVITEHLSAVIHDLAYHEALIDVGRVLASKGVREAIYERYGDVVYRQFKTALKDIAVGEQVTSNGVDKLFNYIRHGSTVAGLGWSFVTTALQPVGLTQSIVRIGPKWVAKGLGRWLRGAVTFEHVVEGIYEKSAFMRNRSLTFQREIAEIRNQIGVNTGKLAAWADAAVRFPTMDKVTSQSIADSYFWMIQKAQQLVDIPTWLGAYEKAMAGGEDEDRAVAMADQAVLDSQGGGQIKDLASVQRGPAAHKLWTTFYSFFSTTLNLTVESTRRTKWNNPASVGRLAVDYMLLYIIPATLGVVIHDAMKGGDDEPEDAEAYAIRLARENAAYLLSTMVGIREITPIVEGFNGWNGPAGARTFSALTKFGAQASQGEFDEQFWRSLNDAAGTVFHYPSAQVWRTLRGVVALDSGETENPLAVIGGAK